MGFFEFLARFSASGQRAPAQDVRALIAQSRFLEARTILEEEISQGPPGDKSCTTFALLALACLGLGLLDEANRAVQAALGLRQDDPEVLYALGSCRARRGLRLEAESDFRRSLDLDATAVLPRVALCRLLCEDGRPAEALSICENGGAIGSEDPRLVFSLGLALLESGRLDEARSTFLQVKTMRPDHVETVINMGVLEARQDRHAEACTWYREAMKRRPGDVDIAINWARSLMALRQNEAALELLNGLDMDSAQTKVVFTLLSELHIGMGNLAHAKLCLAHAAGLDHEDPGLYRRLGGLLMETGHVPEAINTLQKSLLIRETSDAHKTLGLAFLRSFQPSRALDHLESALRLQPADSESRTFIALAKGSLEKDPAEIIEDYRKIIHDDPDQLFAHSNLLFHLSHSPDVSPQEYLQEARRFGERIEQGLEPAASSVPNSHAHQGPKRVGFVSGDLRFHPVGLFLDALVSEVNADRLELYAYSNSHQVDALTQRLKPHFKKWEVISLLDDATAAELIRQDQIDLLIDLSGHTGLNRLGIFPHRPAPVQATWLGYWASTGLTCIDYLIADEWSVPQGEDIYFTERVIRMPVTRLCYGNSLNNSPDVTSSPCIKNGYVTFGCMQSLHKINDGVLMAWTDILSQLSEAHLLIRCIQFNDPKVLARFRSRLLDFGLPVDRIELNGPLPRDQYLHAYAEIDIGLDTFPFPGGTTTTEALWMGVPTIVLPGKTMISRQGSALLHACQLEDWITHSTQEYVKRALDMGRTDSSELQYQRYQFRDKVRLSPLFDSYRFAKDFESLVDFMTGIDS